MKISLIKSSSALWASASKGIFPRTKPSLVETFSYSRSEVFWQVDILMDVDYVSKSITPLRVTKFLCVNKFLCVTSTCHQIPMCHLYLSQIFTITSMCHPISTCHQISMCHIYIDVFDDSFRVQLPNSHQLTFTSSINREGLRNHPA